MYELMFDEAIQKLEDYKSHREPAKDLRYQSYSEWAIDQMIDRLCEEVANDPRLLYQVGLYSPSDIIDIFYLEMEYLEDTSDTPRQRFIFNIAKREADKVIDLFKEQS